MKVLLLLFVEVEFGIEVGSHEDFLFSPSSFFFSQPLDVFGGGTKHSCDGLVQ